MRLHAILLVSATLSAQGPAPGRGVNFYSLEKEQALGAQLAAEYRRQVRVFDAPGANGYLAELGQRLAALAPATGFAYTFELVDDEQTWLHEAAAFPGGPVFVPAVLVLVAAGEDELAAMLAHAIAHIATRRQAPLHPAAIPLIAMGGWGGYAIRQDSVLPLGALPSQRTNELESDRTAVGILSAAGYDQRALGRYIERVQPADAGPNPMAPYPDKNTRLAALRAAIGQLPPATFPAHPGTPSGFDAIQREVARWTVRPAKSPPRLAR